VSREKKELGRRAEEMAEACLRKKGYRIREKNYICARGELDLVAQEGEVLVFVEVRSRKGGGSLPETSVGRAKQRQIVRAAEFYLAERGWEGDCRFDVVAIQLTPSGKLESVKLIRDAFSREGLETFE
jgi:putative endonuclease